MKKAKRRGGARDDSEIYISYTRSQLIDMICRQEQKLGISFRHDFAYRFKEHKSKPQLWRRFKKFIRAHIDGWQQELPLF